MRWITLIVLILPLFLSADSWIVAPQAVAGTSSNDVAASTVVQNSFNAESNTFMVTWNDGTHGDFPYFAIYNGTTWTVSPSLVDSPLNTASFDVISAGYGAGNFLVSWRDFGTGFPVYATYNGTTWTTNETPVPGASNQISSGNIASTSDGGNKVIVTWPDLGTPTYAIYNGTSWQSATAIPTSSLTFSTVFASVDNAGNIMVTWKDRNNHLPFYALYNGTSWVTAEIPDPSITPSIPLADVVPTGNGLNIFMVTWVDTATSLPFYTIFDGSSWTTPQTIPLASTVSSNIVFASSGIADDFMVTWKDQATGFPFYAIYNRNGTWTTPLAIDATTRVANNNVYSSADNQGHYMVTWKDQLTSQPYYAVYEDSSLPPVRPPSSFTGVRLVNDFGVVSEKFDSLSWQPSPTSNILGYKLFLNNVLIAILGPKTTSYQNHNRSKATITYAIEAFNLTETSDQVTLTLGG